MALMIISYDDNVQEDNAIDYPCLMENLNYAKHGETVVVLALSDYVGMNIIMETEAIPTNIGKVGSWVYPFTSAKDWKLYDKAVTFCNK